MPSTYACIIDTVLSYTLISQITFMYNCYLLNNHLTLPNAESDFILTTVVTEHKQLQLWVELHASLIAEVRAIVCFTPSHERNIQHFVTTHSILTANTVMVFQLESHEIPDSVQEDDFLVQVALSVDRAKGNKVPRQLEDASTFSKNHIILYYK